MSPSSGGWRDRLRERALTLALALGSVALVLLVLEGVARVARNRVSGKGALTVDRYMEPDAMLGWRKKPGVRASFHEPEYQTEVVINSLGLRDPERPYEGTGAFRILALGDSFVEGYTVPMEKTVTQTLEASLKDRGCSAEVLNGGTAGYSTDQEYLFYATEGARYAPKIVLLFFYFNDVLYNVRPTYSSGDPKPLLVEQGDRLIVQNLPVPPPRPAPEAAPDPAPDHSGGSALLEWVSGRLRRSTPGLYNRLAWFGLWAPVKHKPPPEQYEVYRRTASPEIKAAWTATEMILSALAREVQQKDARLLIVYVPSRMEVSDRSWAATQFEYGMKEAHWDRGAVRARLQKIADRIPVPVLDLTAPLRAAEHGALGGPYFVQDGHWNAVGHAVAARAVGEDLRGLGWLGGCTIR